MNLSRSRCLVSVAIAAVVPLFGACASARSQLCSVTVPPVAFNLAAADEQLGTVVETVIIPHGPGSWKSDGKWDEYVVSLTNHDKRPVVIAAIELIDSAGNIVPSGQSWQGLEYDASTSQQRATQGFMRGAERTLISLGTSLDPFGKVLGLAAIQGLPLTGLGAAVVAIPALTGKLKQAAEGSEQELTDEFERRRLKLPLTLAQGKTVHQSVFFIVTLAPQRLVVTCQADGETRRIIVDLSPLRDLRASNFRVDRVPQTG